ncbi:MAG: GIY-YIG nuclease family protein [Candidatus Riflebacteria bacterium]|nr:GIY-YIG nuclease family protein [Candidatus Riflebacteria bacterium]
MEEERYQSALEKARIEIEKLTGAKADAMIYSENAPDMENKIHKKFNQKSLNLVNMRKEFFNVSLNELEEFAQESNFNLNITKLAEAKDYRESLKIRAEGKAVQAAELFEETFASSENLFELES